jgi:hypothetical protein
MRKFSLVSSLAATFTLSLCPAMALAGGKSLVATINSDKVYSVQVIAHDKCPQGAFDNSNRRSIAVLATFTPDVKTGDVFVDIADKTNLILLVPGPTFEVKDGNACDADGAKFQLPPLVSTQYGVWVRLVGPPQSGVNVTTCAVLKADTGGLLAGDVVCSTDSLVRTRMTGKGEPSFTDATNKLLKLLNADFGCDPACNLFDPDFQDFFWSWGTTGRPHAQLVFVDLTN